MCRNRFKQFSNFLTLLDISLMYGGRLLKILNCILLFNAKILLNTMYIVLVRKRLCPYPQDCILIWIYEMQINYITLHVLIEGQQDEDCTSDLSAGFRFEE